MPALGIDSNRASPTHFALASLKKATACCCSFMALVWAVEADAGDKPAWPDLTPALASAPTRLPPNGENRKDVKKGDDDIDSEHIFGITHGTDIGKKGELEAHIEPSAAIAKRFGTYFTTVQFGQVKYTVTDSFRVAPGIFAITHDVQDIPGFDDRRQAAFGGGTVELRYRLLDRETGPFGLTLSAEPGRSRIDELAGDRVDQYGAQLAVFLDKEIVRDRVFGAINFIYDLSATRLRSTGEWFHDSLVATNVSVTNQFFRGVFFGAEARYARQYEGVGLDRLKGEALYFGPTFFVRIASNAGLSGGWNFQVAGKAVDAPGSLDLVNFERQQVQLTLNVLLNP